MTIVNDDSRVISKLEVSLTDNARVVIYNHHMFIVQATGANTNKKFWSKFTHSLEVCHFSVIGKILHINETA
jgi:hypothetical protein